MPDIVPLKVSKRVGENDISYHLHDPTRTMQDTTFLEDSYHPLIKHVLMHYEGRRILLKYEHIPSNERKDINTGLVQLIASKKEIRDWLKKSKDAFRWALYGQTD